MTRHLRRRARPFRLASATAATLLLAGGAAAVVAPGATAATTDADVKRGLRQLVAARGGPIGAIVTLDRGRGLTVIRAGRLVPGRAGAPRADDHMRIASVAKAFSGAVALRLVQDGALSLDDTIAQRLPTLPAAWGAVTLRQLLNHTSGVPDYTRSRGFAEAATRAPRAYVSPAKIIGWVRNDRLVFTPGSAYEYSNTDNIIVALMAEAVTGRAYDELLKELVFEPARLRQTSLPTRTVRLPRPYITGWITEPGEQPENVTSLLSPSGAWASGGIVSTPRELNRFIRNDLGLTFFGAEQQREQMQWVRGSSSPPGPGGNWAGLALFRYQTRCGTVYGHTGNFPGYTQFAAATADGSRSVTTTLNIPAPQGRLLRQLRAVQADAVCALLGR